MFDRCKIGIILVWESEGFVCRKPEAMRSGFAKPCAFQGRRRKVEDEYGRIIREKEITTKTALYINYMLHFPIILPSSMTIHGTMNDIFKIEYLDVFFFCSSK